MRFILWFVAYILALVLEVSILPPLLGGFAVSLSVSVLILGVASQGFRPAFWFALLTGFPRDALAPAGAASHTVFALALVFAVHGFLYFRRWDEPLRGIGAVLTGILAVPFAWWATWVAEEVVGADPRYTIRVGDLMSPVFLSETLFALMWFSVFAFVTIASFRKRRARELLRI